MVRIGVVILKNYVLRKNTTCSCLLLIYSLISLRQLAGSGAPNDLIGKQAKTKVFFPTSVISVRIIKHQYAVNAETTALL